MDAAPPRQLSDGRLRKGIYDYMNDVIMNASLASFTEELLHENKTAAVQYFAAVLTNLTRSADDSTYDVFARTTRGNFHDQGVGIVERAGQVPCKTAAGDNVLPTSRSSSDDSKYMSPQVRSHSPSIGDTFSIFI